MFPYYVGLVYELERLNILKRKLDFLTLINSIVSCAFTL